MEQSTLRLITFGTDYIVEYLTKNPVDWSSSELACRGGPGDKAGEPPSPAVFEFLSLLDEQGGLFTQREYWEHCKDRWRDWLTRDEMTRRNARGVKAKLYRNFYPSMIDSLHAWALLNEAGWFDVCVVDTYQDAVGKTDLLLKHGDVTIRVALIGPTDKAQSDRKYKVENRDSAMGNPIEVSMGFDRPRSPGNKRWYDLDDFKALRPDCTEDDQEYNDLFSQPALARHT